MAMSEAGAQRPSGDRERLLFVAPWFLFPTISGGRIRTVDILRGMKGGRYEITLLSPQPERTDGDKWQSEIDSICDHFVGWADDTKRGKLQRGLGLLSKLPMSVALDRSPLAQKCIGEALAAKPDVVVFDFVHTAVLWPDEIGPPSLVFTHNVESEIYARHAKTSERAAMRAIWRSQSRKMASFEREQLARFDTTIAVSERDKEQFVDGLGQSRVEVVPTGVDVDFHSYSEPRSAADLQNEEATLVFTGSMNWLPNVDGLKWFLEHAWSKLQQAAPKLRLKIVGRNPDAGLVAEAKGRGLPWEFTGFVDDVRPHIRAADVCVLPLWVGGGTRLKAYEAMALGCPTVATTIAVEGLPLVPDEHYLLADTADDFVAAVLQLLRDGAQRQKLSLAARAFVEQNFSSKSVARAFEAICGRAQDR
ncbi:MAG: glycosyltransferase [Planctomycetota bacterium]